MPKFPGFVRVRSEGREKRYDEGTSVRVSDTLENVN